MLVASLNVNFAKADTSNYVTSTFKMDNGARVRLDNKKALGFVTRISKAEFDAIIDAEGADNVSVVMMITPADYLMDENSQPIAFTKENFVNDGPLAEGEEIKAVTVKFNTANNNLYGNENGKQAVSGDDYLFRGCVYNIPDRNLTREFAARTYIEVKGQPIAYSQVENTNAEYKSGVAADIAEIALDNNDWVVDYDETSEQSQANKANLTYLCQKFTVDFAETEYNTPAYQLIVRRGEKLSKYYDEILENVYSENFAYYSGDTSIDETQIITENLQGVVPYFNAPRFVGLDSEGNETTVENAIVSYQVSAGTANRFVNITNKLVIPGTFKGKSVTAVEQGYDDGVRHGFINSPFEIIIFGEETTTVNRQSFAHTVEGEQRLKEVHLPGATSIGNLAFAWSVKLEKVVLSSELETIGTSAFYNDMNANGYREGTAVKNTVSLFFTGAVPSYTIGENQNLLSGKVFVKSDKPVCENYWNYDSKQEIVKVEFLGHNYVDGECSVCGAFNYDTQGIVYEYDETNECYFVSDIGTFNGTELNILSKYNDGEHDKADVTYIKANAFNQKGATFTTVILPDSVTKIGERAFRMCSNLQVLNAPSVTEMGGFALYNCAELTTVYAPNLTTFVGFSGEGGSNLDVQRQFSYCPNLQTVILSSELTELPELFWYSTATKSLDILLSGAENNITNLNLSNSTSSGNNMLSGKVFVKSDKPVCENYWNYDSKQEIVKVEVSGHDYVDGKCSVCGEYNTQGIAYEYDATNDCYYVSSIGTCTAKDVTFLSKYSDGNHEEKSVTYIKDAAFAGTSSVPTTATFTSITIPASITRIGTKAFSRNNQLIEVKILGNATIEDSFFLCANLKTVIAENVLLDNVKENAFYCCANLETLVVSGNSTSVDISSFDNGGTTVQNSKLHIYLCGAENKLTEKGTTDNGNTLYESTQVYAQGTTPGTWKYVDGVPQVNA